MADFSGMKSIFLSLSCNNKATKTTYLLLELERDASDGAFLNSLHEMAGVTYLMLDKCQKQGMTDNGSTTFHLTPFLTASLSNVGGAVRNFVDEK